MNSTSVYVAFALLVAVAIADDSRSKKEAIYNPYGQTTAADANKYLATAGFNNYYNNQQVPYNGYQPAAYSAYNQQYYQQQPLQRSGAYPYNGDTAAVGYNHGHQLQYYNQFGNNNNYPYGGYQQYSGYQPYPYSGYQQYAYNGNAQYPYTGNQQYAYTGNQQYPYTGNQQYPYNTGNVQQYGYQNPLAYNNAYNFRQAPVYPSPGAQPISPPVPHPFYHTQGTYYPTSTEANKPTVTVVTVDPKKQY